MSYVFFSFTFFIVSAAEFNAELVPNCYSEDNGIKRIHLSLMGIEQTNFIYAAPVCQDGQNLIIKAKKFDKWESNPKLSRFTVNRVFRALL